MGGSDSDAYDDEKPVHSVTLSDFYIGETEVTQSLWQAVMGGNPSYFQNGNLPVEDISWYDCQEFIQRLNAKTGKKFCMPTEAQWEYAALGGKMRKGYKYSGSNSISSVGWYDSNCNETTHNVKSLVANELGLYDMTGNVYEWCQDWYADKYDCNSATDPTGPYSGTLRVVRSGSWKSKARNCRTAYRFKYTPEYHFRNLGLRLCISPNAATVDNSDAIFRQRLMDFKKKITSTPFERDATECVKTIDNEHYKYLFFLGNITKDDDGDFDYYFGCIFCYNAVSGQVFKLQNGQFTQCSETNVSRKMLGWRYDETNRNANNGCGYGLFDIKDYSSKGFCILQFNGVGDSGLFKIDMSDLSTHFLNGETVQDKYIVEYGKRWGPEIGPIDTRTIKKVIDLSTGQEIGNPFIKAGTVSFSGQNNTQVNLTIDKSASVTGYVTYKGQPYNVISGNQTINGDINLKVDYVDGVGVDCFIIKKNGGRYILKGVYLDVWEAEEKFNMEILKQ